jgi:hypothetical protein
MMMILSKYFPNGVSGFIFQCAIQDGILCIGIPYWLKGSVKWYSTEVENWDQSVPYCLMVQLGSVMITCS